MKPQSTNRDGKEVQAEPAEKSLNFLWSNELYPKLVGETFR